jgi:hypothetical protein
LICTARAATTGRWTVGRIEFDGAAADRFGVFPPLRHSSLLPSVAAERVAASNVIAKMQAAIRICDCNLQIGGVPV